MFCLSSRGRGCGDDDARTSRACSRERDDTIAECDVVENEMIKERYRGGTCVLNGCRVDPCKPDVIFLLSCVVCLPDHLSHVCIT